MLPQAATVDDTELLERFERHLRWQGMAPNTVTNYLADMRCYLRWAEKHRLNASPTYLRHLDAQEIRAFRAHLAEEAGCAWSTINRRLQTLRKYCAYAFQMGILPQNPMEEVSLLSSGREPSGDILSPAEVNRLIVAAERARGVLKHRNKTLLLLLGRGGLKVSQVLDLRLADLVLDHPGVRLVLRRGDTPHEQALFLDAETKQALAQYLSVRPQVERVDNLFVGVDGRPLSARTVQRVVSRCGALAGINGVTPQKLRRAYAAELYRESGSIHEVARTLGHRHPATTAHYLGTLVSSAGSVSGQMNHSRGNEGG